MEYSEGVLEPAPRVSVEREPVTKVKLTGNWNSHCQEQGPER